MDIRTFAEMSPEEQRQAVAAFADTKAEEKYYFSNTELMNEFGISNNLALKYIEEMVATGEWVYGELRGHTRFTSVSAPIIAKRYQRLAPYRRGLL